MNIFAGLKDFFRHLNSVLDIESRNKKNPVKTKIIFATLSLLSSVFLWAFVAWDGTSEITRTIEVPIEYTNVAQNMGIFQHTNSVSVKVAGNMAALSRLNKAELSAKVILASMEPGKYDLPVMVDAPSGVRVVSWKPSLVDVEIYKKYEKLIPINLKPLGEEENADMFTAEILPASALVSGPIEEIKSIKSLEARVPVKILREGNPYTTELVAVNAQEKPVTRISINPKSVIIKPHDVENGTLYPIKIKLSGQPAAGYEINSVNVTPQEIALKGKKADLEQLHAIELPEIDVSNVKGNLHVVLPIDSKLLGNDIKIIGIDKATVDVIVTKENNKKTFNAVPIQITGAKHGEKWICEPAMANIVAEGVKQLSEPTDVPCSLYVDVSSIVSPKITLPVIVKNIKKGVKVINIDPEEVIVRKE